ncbi:MAG: DNA polymerase III subunit epsilon [Rhizobiaceae bacterium]
MREIIFDTETTGLRPEDGERVIEIGAVELIDRFPTGKTFHVYINPEGRAVHPEALRIHGITDEFLRDKPTFSVIVADFIEFVGDGMLVAHNAGFDMGFINAELARLGQSAIPPSRIIDTLMLARKRHPMGPNSLDALCQRYGINNSHRTYHGALLDSELLAEVYIELNGGRQATLVLDSEPEQSETIDELEPANYERKTRPRTLEPRLSQDDIARHQSMIGALGQDAIWLDWQKTSPDNSE